jgi:hypothetical protein
MPQKRYACQENVAPRQKFLLDPEISPRICCQEQEMRGYLMTQEYFSAVE